MVADKPGTGLRLGDLLDDPTLGLRLVVGDDAARRRRVIGTHPLEVDEPTKWLARGWVMLTVGMRLHRHPKEQRALIADLDSRGVAALGFGEGVVFDTVPPAILDEAARRNFPVFVVPPETPFRDVISASYRGSLNADSGAFQRLTSMQQTLLEALGDEVPQETIVERLAWIVAGTVGLISPEGELLATTGNLPLDDLRAVLQEQRRLTELHLAEWRFVVAPVRVRAEDPPIWLVAGSKRDSFSVSTAEPAVRATVPLLVALRRLGEASLHQERASRAALLEQMLENRRSYDLVELTHRARVFGIDFEDRTVGIAIRRRVPPKADGDAEYAVWRPLVKALEQAGLPHLSLVRSAETVALVQAKKPEVLWHLLERVVNSEDDLLIAMGKDVRDVDGVPGSVADATLVARRLAEQPDGPRLAEISSLDLPRALLSQADPGLIGPIAGRLLDSIGERPHMLETLTAYFGNDLDIPATAKAMYVHPNTLRYRLRQIETIVGASLHDPATLTALYLALEARDAGMTGAEPGAKPARILYDVPDRLR